MSAQPKPIDAFRLNADECAKFDAPLTVLRLTPCEREALRIEWEYGRGGERIASTRKALSEFSGLPAEFFDEHLPAAYQQMAEQNLPMFKQVQRGLYVPSTGYSRPSVTDTTLFRQIQDEIEFEHPVNPLARVQIATGVLRAYGAVLPEPEPEPEPGETRAKGKVRPRRIPTAPHALNLILRSADDIVTRANQDPGVDDVALLAHATTALQALLDKQRKVRQEQIEGSATVISPAAEPSATVISPAAEPSATVISPAAEPSPSATVNSPPSPDLLPTVISATVISPVAEPSPDSDANVDEREEWERGDWQPSLGPIAERNEGETMKVGNGVGAVPARQFAEVASSPARSNLSTHADSEHGRGWNPDYNSRNLNDRLRALADERGVKWHMMSCPLHTDTTPSVHVDDDGERVGMYCHSCRRSGRAILDAIDGGVVPVPVLPVRVPEPPTDGSQRARIIATYVYRDAKGSPAYKVLRTDPKGFPTMRFDEARGNYVRGMAGTDRILYRLPELLSADQSETVFVVEGEKSANLLARHGFVVTAIGGATKWNASTMVEPLRNRRVIVLPDNDGAGDDVAFEITLALWGVAARTSVLPLPGLGYKEDVFDWFAAGHSLEDLLRLVSEID